MLIKLDLKGLSKMYKIIWWCILAVILYSLLCIFTYGTETEECQRLAPKYNAQTEYVLWDNTRIDLLSDEYAIEVDWSNKWEEAVGQSVYYSIVSNRKPAIILLVKDFSKESRFIYRCYIVCTKLDIKLYLEKVND